MSDLVAVALIATTPGMLAAIQAFLNYRIASRNSTHIEKQARAMELLEKNTNSMKDALVKVTGEAKFAEGLKSGREEER